MKKQWKYILALGTAGIALSQVNCSSSSSPSAGASSKNLSNFALALAEDMVLSSPTAQKSSAFLPQAIVLSENNDGVRAFAMPTAEASPQLKKEAIEGLVAATAPASCAINLNIMGSGRANCYGPSVNYTNHELDNSSGSWPGGDLGIWETSEVSGQACSAAQLTSQMRGAISYIDLAQFVSAGMSCIANKNGETLPAVGQTLTLTSQMSGLVTVDSQAMTVTTATLNRAANDTAGNPVYVTTIVGTAGSKTYSVRIKHVSTSADDSTNKGKISVKVASSGSSDLISLQYEKTSATAGKMLLKKVNYNGSDPYVSVTDYSVDFTKTWAGNADYLLTEMNPADYTGSFYYSWQAGSGDSHARTFNAKISSSSGVTSATSFFGFGPTMQAGPGSIAGMICAWTGPGSTHTPVSKVQRQDMTLNLGTFVVSGTSKTVFDPVADCDASGSMSMTWGTGGSRAVSSTTENLAPLSDVSSVMGTAPSAPANVDQ